MTMIVNDGMKIDFAPRLAVGWRGDAAAWPVQGPIGRYRHEIEKRIDDYSKNATPAVYPVAAE